MALETRREDLSGAWDCWGDEQERMLKERMDPQLGIGDRVRSRIKPLKQDKQCQQSYIRMKTHELIKIYQRHYEI